MLSRREEERPQIDHLALVQRHLTGHRTVQSIEMGSGTKQGSSKADLRVNGETVTVDHALRRLTITTTNTDLVAKEVKRIWRNAHGPRLKTREVR